MNYKNAFEELRRLYEKSEQEKYKLILDSNGLINANGILQQENARLKDKIKKSFKIVDDKLTNLDLKYGINNEFREEYDELWEILKEN